MVQIFPTVYTICQKTSKLTRNHNYKVYRMFDHILTNMLFNVISSFLIVSLLFVFKDSLWVKKVKFFTKYVVLYAWVASCSIVLVPMLIWRPYCHKNGSLTSSLIVSISKQVGVTWSIRNEKVLTNEGAAVIVANHQSAFDLLGLCFIWKKVIKMAPVGKRSFIYTGPVALTGYLSGFVYIHRNDSKKAYENLKKMLKVLLNKYKIWMYVEGTRNKKNDGNLLPFKKGAFNMAVTAQVPIIPVVHSPYYFIDQKRYTFNRGEIVLQCLEPIPTVGLTKEDVPALAERVHEIMSQTYKQLWADVYMKVSDKEN